MRVGDACERGGITRRRGAQELVHAEFECAKSLSEDLGVGADPVTALRRERIVEHLENVSNHARDSDGSAKYHGQFDAETGDATGWGTFRYQDGSVYDGRWKKGLPHYHGSLHLVRPPHPPASISTGSRPHLGRSSQADGSVYDGQFRRGVIAGRGTCEYYMGDTYTGQWFDDDKCGHGRRVHDPAPRRRCAAEC